jgi:circadian clock protein KaiC
MVSRLIDFLKGRGITTLFNSLSGGTTPESDIGVSSIMDTWIVLRNNEINGELSRLLYILKSRGMAHSNQVREFVMSERGVELADVYIGPAGVLTGTARLAQDAKDRTDIERRYRDLEKLERQYIKNRDALNAQMVAMQSEIESADREIELVRQEAKKLEADLTKKEAARSKARWADSNTSGQSGKRRGRPKKQK